MTSKTCAPSSKQRFGISRSRSQSRCVYMQSQWILCVVEYASLTDEEAECLFASELHRTCEELEETIAFYQKQIDVCKEEKAE